MEVVLLIGLIIVIVLIVTYFNSLNEKVDTLNSRISVLAREIKKLSDEAGSIQKKESSTHTETVRQVEVRKPAPQIIVPPVETPPVIIQESKSVPISLSVSPNPNPVLAPAVHKAEVKPPKPGFFERNPDLEKFIGENLINKIGIAILVLGIGFFVKFAIDQEWISETGRVLIGMLCGVILIGVAHYLRKTFTAFSSVLVGGGIAVFYFTIALAFREYAILSQTAAFIIMVLITLFAVLISLLYDKQELAVLAILGGFIAPLLLSTGSGNYIVLFTYVSILITGMLALAYFKKWRIVNIVSYVFTMLLYGIWLSTKVLGEANAPYLGALCFATIFYFIFFIMNIINNVKEHTKFEAIDISILLSNTFLYFSAGMCILHYVNGGIYQGLFTGLIAIFNLVFTYVLFKNKKVDTNLLYLLIGIVLTFISLAAPIQLEGNYITLFWALEAVLLLWLYQKSEIQIFRLSAVIVQLLMLISLVMDWSQFYRGTEIHMVILNKAFVTGIVSFVSLVLTVMLLRKEERPFFEGFPASYYSAAVKVVSILCIYFVFLLELVFQLQTRIGVYEITELYAGIYNYFFLTVLVIGLIRFMPGLNQFFLPVVSFLLYTGYLFHYQLIIRDVRNTYLTTAEPALIVYLSHYVLVGLLIAAVSYMFVFMMNEYKKKSDVFNICLWIFCFLLVYVASIELENIVLMAAFQPGDVIASITKSNYKIGFPVLWGVCSFLMMVIGMKGKMKMLRIISLSLFAITLLKLFIFDVRNMSEGGKIGAFISLGIILLVISFLYQKLKKIITEDDANENS